MDFRQNSQSTVRPTSSVGAEVGAEAPKQDKKVNGKDSEAKWSRLLSAVVLFGIAILIAAVAFAFTRSETSAESKLVDGSKYQAVFLNNGQVYFGNVTALNSKYINLTHVYYLTQNSATDAKGVTTNNGYTLVKLGCQQIHDPYDQMVINRDQVTFWENLVDKGTVVSKINEFKKSFPNGPDCTQVSNQTQAAADATTQATGTAPKK
ncbi:MAG: hypothetical protein WC498_04205 [Candidatus Saccharimonadales bacterium]